MLGRSFIWPHYTCGGGSGGVFLTRSIPGKHDFPPRRVLLSFPRASLSRVALQPAVICERFTILFYILSSTGDKKKEKKKKIKEISLQSCFSLQTAKITIPACCEGALKNKNLHVSPASPRQISGHGAKRVALARPQIRLTVSGSRLTLAESYFTGTAKQKNNSKARLSRKPARKFNK